MKEEDLGLAYRCADLYYRSARSQAEIAEALGKPSANAARMAVSRALLQVAEVMSGR